jgi:uncharacterized UBP type Zn finger protein
MLSRVKARPEDHKDNLFAYGLYAVIAHIGSSVRTEHYVAYVKDPRGGWFQLDDYKVSQVSLSEVLKVQAYLLFL